MKSSLQVWSVESLLPPATPALGSLKAVTLTGMGFKDFRLWLPWLLRQLTSLDLSNNRLSDFPRALSI